jgi:ABC-2 type transport system permease protein
MTALEKTVVPRQADPGTAPGAPLRRTSKPSLSRLTLVELRKLADTRAGLWLLIIIVLASVATTVIMLTAAADDEQTFAGFFTFAQLPAGVLLPVLGILSMTSEWTQRTALGTFTLVPQRGRVVAAKLSAAVLIAVIAAASGFVFAAAGNMIAGGSWSISWQLVAQCVALQVVWVLMGSAFGALLMNSPLAIVLYLVMPTLWSVLGEMVSWLRRAAGWLDINLTSMPLSEPGMTADQWARFGVAALVWVALPLALGTVRVLRREVS